MSGMRATSAGTFALFAGAFARATGITFSGADTLVVLAGAGHIDRIWY